MARLRIGWHTATPSALAHIRMPASGSGLIVGEDRDRRPVAVRLFRPEPTSVTLVGQISTAQLLLFRALALGASAIVVTSAPRAWSNSANAPWGSRIASWSTPVNRRSPPSAQRGGPH
jgi:hypothetical protein